MKCLSVRLLWLVCLLGTSVSWSQVRPNAASVLKEQEASTRVAPVPPEPPGMPVAPASASPQLAAPGGPLVQVRQIRVEGAQALATDSDLQALVAPWQGRALEMAQLQQLAKNVTEWLHARGWLLAQAYLPPQDVTEGVLEIRVKPGRIQGGLEGVLLDGHFSRIDPVRVRRMLAQAMPSAEKGLLNATELEQALLRIGELAGLSAKASLQAGTEPETSRVVVELKENEALQTSLSMDNLGGRYTGIYKLTAMATLQGAMGQGESLTAVAGYSAGTQMLTLSGNYPVGLRGSKLGASLTTLRYQVGGPLADLGLHGSANILGLSLTQPLLLGAARNLRASLNLDHKSFTDQFGSSTLADKRAQVLAAGLNGDWTDAWMGGGLNFWGTTLSRGHMDLSRVSSSLQADQEGPRVDGAYSKWTANYMRMQPLSSQWMLQASVNAQGANKNLDGSEKLVLGGSTAIRAYPSGEAAGDAGWVGSLSLRHDVPGEWREHRLQWQAFWDFGHIRLNRQPWSEPSNASGANSYNLQGAGLGLTLSRPGAYRLNLFWASVLGNNPGRSVNGLNSDGRADRHRIGITLSLER